MAEKDEEIGFKKDTVSKLLSSFFKEDKTRLSGDAVLLMAEMLKVFVQGKELCVLQLCSDYLMVKVSICCLIFPEAAVRSQKQAESEDCDQVDIEHFEKILPQLLLDF
ncbi:centromere protein X isoform X1 [Chaetodon trifascialis]|uniref:centromere protein X isoform X1 n=1 Tax=Chaetodon trifascialis TaxID=109706 RepID=UPI003993C308